MKKNQMEVMREARNRALREGVAFYTMNLKNDSGKKGRGNILVAYRRMNGEDFADKSIGRLIFSMPGVDRCYRVQFSFCSPNEKNPSRTFGEGQAVLRFFNPQSALFLRIGSEHTLTEGLRLAALDVGKQRQVPWLFKKTIKDLV